MLTILLRVDGQTGPAPGLTFDRDEIVLGRDAECDVILPDPSVSQRHAVIRARPNGYGLTDAGSTNGTFVGEEPVTGENTRLLGDGDLIRLGRVWLEVRTIARESIGAIGGTRDLAIALLDQAMRARGEALARIYVKEGTDVGLEFPLYAATGEVIVGRHAACELTLRDALVSRSHVRITRTGDGVFVCDLGTKNGTYLGKARLDAGEDVLWTPGKLLRVGGSVLLLRDAVASAMVALEQSRDETIIIEDLPPPVPPVACVETTPQALATTRRRGLTEPRPSKPALATAALGLPRAVIAWLVR